MQLIRPPSLTPPDIATPHPLPKFGADGRQPVVRIYHPGYAPPEDQLISIPAFDPLPGARGGQEGHSWQAAHCLQAEEQVQEHQGAQGKGRQESGEPVQVEVEVDVGIHHGTVLTICGIIADNAFDRVFLSTDPDGLSRVDEHWHYDGILPAGEYWLQVAPMPVNPRLGGGAGSLQVVPREETGELRGVAVSPGGEEPSVTRSTVQMPPPPRPAVSRNRQTPYPIVPNFESWRFPHGRLPSAWSRAHEPPAAIPAPGISNLVAQRLRDLRPPYTAPLCAISAHGGAIDQAHIIPKACIGWFTHNGMHRYNDPTTRQAGYIDQPPNKIDLRSDLHNLFDARYLAIVPKPVSVQAPSLPSSSAQAAPRTSPQYTLAVHVLNTPTNELIPLYHNLALRYRGPGSGPSQQYLDSREFLFARFAWSIFGLLRVFLATERWVVVRSSQAQSDFPAAARYEYKWASNASLTPKTPSSRSSSKRPASEIEYDVDADYNDEVHRSKRRRSFSPKRVRPVEQLLNSREEPDEDEPFQLDEASRHVEELHELDSVQREVERWRAQTFFDCGDMDVKDEDMARSKRCDSYANSPPDLSFSYPGGSSRSSALLSAFPDVADHVDGNVVLTDVSAGKAGHTPLADVVDEHALSDGA